MSDDNSPSCYCCKGNKIEYCRFSDFSPKKCDTCDNIVCGFCVINSIRKWICRLCEGDLEKCLRACCYRSVLSVKINIKNDNDFNKKLISLAEKVAENDILNQNLVNLINNISQ